MKCESVGVFALNIAPLLCGDDDGVMAAVEDARAGVVVAVRASTENSGVTEGPGADISSEDSVADSET